MLPNLKIPVPTKLGAMHFFAQLSSSEHKMSTQVRKYLALLMLKQADGAKNASHPAGYIAASVLMVVLRVILYAKRIVRTTRLYDANDRHVVRAYRNQASRLNGLHLDNVQALPYVCAFAIRRKVGRIR
jgi:hypothetical protein